MTPDFIISNPNIKGIGELMSKDKNKSDTQLITSLALLVESEIHTEKLRELLEKYCNHSYSKDSSIITIEFLDSKYLLIINFIDYNEYSISYYPTNKEDAFGYLELSDDGISEKKLSYDRVLYYLNKMCERCIKES